MFFDRDDDLITCEYCGNRYYPEVGFGHVCKEGIEASRREIEELNRKYEGSGEKIKFRLTLDIECYNTRDAIYHVLTDISTNCDSLIIEKDSFFLTGKDELMGCSWKVKKETK